MGAVSPWQASSWSAGGAWGRFRPGRHPAVEVCGRLASCWGGRALAGVQSVGWWCVGAFVPWQVPSLEGRCASQAVVTAAGRLVVPGRLLVAAERMHTIEVLYVAWRPSPCASGAALVPVGPQSLHFNVAPCLAVAVACLRSAWLVDACRLAVWGRQSRRLGGVTLPGFCFCELSVSAWAVLPGGLSVPWAVLPVLRGRSCPAVRRRVLLPFLSA